MLATRSYAKDARGLAADLDASLDAWKSAEISGSAYAMVNARMAESYACELLERPERELAAMEEALAIARKSQSKIAESRALVNLTVYWSRTGPYYDPKPPSTLTSFISWTIRQGATSMGNCADSLSRGMRVQRAKIPPGILRQTNG